MPVQDFRIDVAVMPAMSRNHKDDVPIPSRVHMIVCDLDHPANDR